MASFFSNQIALSYVYLCNQHVNSINKYYFWYKKTNSVQMFYQISTWKGEVVVLFIWFIWWILEWIPLPGSNDCIRKLIFFGEPVGNSGDVKIQASLNYDTIAIIKNDKWHIYSFFNLEKKCRIKYAPNGYEYQCLLSRVDFLSCHCLLIKRINKREWETTRWDTGLIRKTSVCGFHFINIYLPSAAWFIDK